MKKIEILTPPVISRQNQGYALYLDGKKVWESANNLNSDKGEEIRVDDLLTALGFKLHIIEVTDKVIEDNYGIFPDDLDDLSEYPDEDKFQQVSIEKNAIPGDDYDFDSIFLSDVDLSDDDDFAYEHDYDFPDSEQPENVDWIGIEDFYNEEDVDNWD